MISCGAVILRRRKETMDKLPDNFCGLSEEFSRYDNAKIVVVPVPFDGTRNWIVGKKWKAMDTSKGPDAIIEASRNMELYDEETDTSVSEKGINTREPIVDTNPETLVDSIETATRNVLADNKFPVIIGGEHSVSFGAVKACKKAFPDLSVLQIDAHSDLRDEYEGTKYSHAAVMSRVREVCPAVQVGIRSMSDDEADLIKEKRYPIFFAKDIVDNDSWFDKAISQLGNHVYITIDLDGLDPSIMPATGTPEPGGMMWYQVLRFLKKVAEERTVVGFDVVELAPIKGVTAPDFLTARLIYKLLGYIHR